MNKHHLETPKYPWKCLETQTCSFDVFDTFLLRACTTPDGVYERAFQLLPLSKGFPDARATFVQHRRRAESRAREAAEQKTGSPEVGISEIYRLFPFRLFGLTPAALPDLVAAEFAAEIDLCRANPDMLREYLALRAGGVRTGFISDTYWSVAQLGELLTSCHPGLTWDFIYSSSESRTNKSSELFAIYLSQQVIAPSQAMHLGDNEGADIAGARRHGIAARHIPQATPAMASIFQRESAVSELLSPRHASTLDHGSRSLRRLIAKELGERSAEFDLGAQVLGPVMQAFDGFVADRVARLERNNGGAAAVAFLARDGFLPLQVWTKQRERPACYLEINRRIGVMGSADTLDPLLDLLGRIGILNAKVFQDIVKVLPKKVARFFAQCPDGATTGPELVKALPDLLRASEIATMATEIRIGLLAYLRRQIPNFDSCRDLVLVDLGYAGSIQKALRRIFDLEGIKIRLHGLYLLTVDDAFDHVGGDDSYEGFISDHVVTPHGKRLLLRNVAVLEQLCCSGAGSVRGYRDGRALHEANPQSAGQSAFCAEAQAGALAFVDAVRSGAAASGFSPFADLEVAARNAAAALGRLLLLPTDDELQRIGALRHDVNLGTMALAPMFDATFSHALQVTQSFPDACSVGDPPMWLAGSMAALSPADNFLYLLYGANRLPGDVIGDLPCGQIEIGLFGADGSASLAQVGCFRNGHGELRVRIPIARDMKIQTLVVPIGKLAAEGLIDGPFVQSGDSVKHAARSIDIKTLSDQQVSYGGVARSGRHFQALNADAALVITLPAQAAPVLIVSLGLTPLGDHRVMAS